jgi:hypothetical protein
MPACGSAPKNDPLSRPEGTPACGDFSFLCQRFTVFQAGSRFDADRGSFRIPINMLRHLSRPGRELHFFTKSSQGRLHRPFTGPSAQCVLPFAGLSPTSRPNSHTAKPFFSRLLQRLRPCPVPLAVSAICPRSSPPVNPGIADQGHRPPTFNGSSPARSVAGVARPRSRFVARVRRGGR